MLKKAFCCWSGGKDCSLALYKAKNSGIEVPYLLNMASEDGKHSCSHGLGVELLKNQAAAAGLSFIQGKTADKEYEKEFKKTIQELKAHGVNCGVYGDIDLMVHREWIERVAADTGTEAVFPLWEIPREELMEEFISAGFKAVVCSVNKKFLGEEWLGREIGSDFIRDIKNKGGIDLCGEKGEFHSFIYDGPLFMKPVEFMKGKIFSDDKYFFMEISPVIR